MIEYISPVESGIELPGPDNAGRRGRYPWRALQVGDSFLFRKGVARRTAASMASRMGQRLGVVYATRSMNTGIRCWRIR